MLKKALVWSRAIAIQISMEIKKTLLSASLGKNGVKLTIIPAW